MVKKLTARVGEYEKDGQKKGVYVNLGVIMSNSNGEYMLLDPTVDLAGVLMQQRILAQQTGKKAGDRVMVSIWDDSNRDNGGSGGGGYSSGGGQSSGGIDDEILF